MSDTEDDEFYLRMDQRLNNRDDDSDDYSYDSSGERKSRAPSRQENYESAELEDTDSEDEERDLIGNAEVSKVTGAIQLNGELMFIVEWKDKSEPGLVPSKEVYKKFPQVAIKFFESNVKFKEPETKKPDTLGSS